MQTSTLNKTARIEDVAKRAGVSMKTVSRVLNNEPNVREKMRERVLIAVKELNYRPNLSARSLAGSKNYLIGFVYGQVGPAYLYKVQEGALHRCREANYGMVLYPLNTENIDVLAEMKQILDHGSIDGLVLPPPLSDDEKLLALITEYGLPFVRISPMDPENGSTVSINDRSAANWLMEHLLELGHRKIGFINGPVDHGASAWRFESYKESLKTHGIPYIEDYVLRGDFTYNSGLEAGLKMLANNDRPTAVFASNDEMAVGVMHAAADLGLSVPNDISVVGFDDAPISRQCRPGLTTIRQPMRELGRMAMNELMQVIQRSQEPSQIELEYEVIIRDSTAKPSA